MEIQRDRDHGVGDLNTVLQDHDMQPITSWDQFGPRGQVTVINNNNINNNNDKGYLERLTRIGPKRLHVL